MDFVHENGARGRRFLPEITIGGAGWIDHDVDGLFDLYLANGHVLDNIAIAVFWPNMAFAQPDQLIENEIIDAESSPNRARGRFADVSSRAGEWFSRATVSRSAGSCDHDNDGDEDISVLSSGSRAVLLRNDGPHGHWIAFQLQGTRSNRDGTGAKVAVQPGRAAIRSRASSSRGALGATRPRAIPA